MEIAGCVGVYMLAVGEFLNDEENKGVNKKKEEKKSGGGCSQ